MSCAYKLAGIKAIICTATGNVIKEAQSAIKKCPDVQIKIVAEGTADGWHPFSEYEDYSDVYECPSDDSAPMRDELMLMYFLHRTPSYTLKLLRTSIHALSHFLTSKWWHSVNPRGVYFTIAETGWEKAVWGKLYGQWLCGCCVFTYDFDKFEQDKVLNMIEKYRISSFCAPPTIYRFMVKADLAKFDLSSLENMTTAGEALNPEVFNQLKAATGLSIMEGFGQTETTLTIANLVGMTPKLGSMGKPTPIYKLHLADAEDKEVPTGEVGEICIDISRGRPYGLFREYYGNIEETNRTVHDRLYHTGDMAWSDEEGYLLFFVGRTDDIIKSSGYRIGPFEIESVLMEHPAVLECAATGVPDSVRGQIIKATIVLTNGYEPSDDLKVEI